MRLIDADELKENLLGEWYVESNETIFNHVFDLIDNSTTVERPQGEWVVDGCLIACNKCGRILLKANELYNFCPNCGADMRGKEE